MTLSEKLNTIDYPRVTPFKAGKADTISKFWDNFIKPTLITENVIRKWCEVLYKYVEDIGVVYAIRTFNDRRENGDKDLRRGFVTTTNRNYSFFYTDNYFSAYFFKMAMDGYIPEYSEFKNMMTSRTFPARFGQSCKSERDRAAYKINGKDPKINGAGYKISHIFDVGTGYSYNNITIGIAQIASRFFPRGNYDDWTPKTDTTGTYYSRNFNIIDESALEYLKAIFLRMTCPLNYILTPKKNMQTTEVKIDKNDIGECIQLQQYAIYQFSKIYGDLYKDFTNRIMLSSEYKLNENSGSYYVGIKYDINSQFKRNIHSLKQNDSNKEVSITLNSNNTPNMTNLLKAECLKAYLFDGLSFRRIEIDVMHIESPARGGGFKAQTLMRSFNISTELKGIFNHLSVEALYKKMMENGLSVHPALELIFSELL
ncbi:MAG: hypothetical protein IKZ86_14600 [Spirochaetaceae bacterium]|nr:hypothetical protein [Spirochaetaceae bacterium]